jgi:starch synthase
MTHGIFRAVEVYQQQEKMQELRRRMMQLDFSWQSSVREYLDLYRGLVGA